MKKAIIAFALGAVAVSGSTSFGAIVINEVYGGGGNSGAPFSNDFVELYNNGTAAVPIAGYMLQYTSSTGTSFTSNSVTISDGASLAPGAFYLIGLAAGSTTSTPLPTPNQTGTINISASSGKVRLLDNATAPAVIDFVGFGSANEFEGLAAAPTGSNTVSISRLLDGVDTNQNAVDFATAFPTPGATNAVPEPATLSLLGLGGLALLRRRRA